MKPPATPSVIVSAPASLVTVRVLLFTTGGSTVALALLAANRTPTVAMRQPVPAVWRGKTSGSTSGSSSRPPGRRSGASKGQGRRGRPILPGGLRKSGGALGEGLGPERLAGAEAVEGVALDHQVVTAAAFDRVLAAVRRVLDLVRAAFGQDLIGPGAGGDDVLTGTAEDLVGARIAFDDRPGGSGAEGAEIVVPRATPLLDFDPGALRTSIVSAPPPPSAIRSVVRVGREEIDASLLRGPG